MTASQYDYL